MPGQPRRILAAVSLLSVAAITTACASGSTDATGASTSSTGSGSTTAGTAPSASASSADPPAAVRQVDASEAAVWAVPLIKPVTKDEFDDDRNGWTTHGGESWKLEITGGQYVWTVPPGADYDEEPSTLAATPAQVGSYRVGSRVTTTDIASVGFDCAFDDSGDVGQSYYRLSVTDEGPQITMRRNGSQTVTLARAEAPRLTDGVPVAFEAVCVQQAGDYRLGLLVDGAPVLAVVDSDPLPVTVPSAFWTRALSADRTDAGVAAYDYYRVYAAGS
jgi:hypothetical protein